MAKKNKSDRQRGGPSVQRDRRPATGITSARHERLGNQPRLGAQSGISAVQKPERPQYRLGRQLAGVIAAKWRQYRRQALEWHQSPGRTAPQYRLGRQLAYGWPSLRSQNGCCQLSVPGASGMASCRTERPSIRTRASMASVREPNCDLTTPRHPSMSSDRPLPKPDPMWSASWITHLHGNQPP